MRARFAGTCATCGEPIAKGQQVTRGPLIAGKPRTWSHQKCGEAAAEYERNRELVLAGETFAAHKPPDWRLGKAPGSARARA